jgi:hypothetical protein
MNTTQPFEELIARRLVDAGDRLFAHTPAPFDLKVPYVARSFTRRF